LSVRKGARITGTLMVAAGICLLAWVIVVWRWQDPFTALYTNWKQHQLSDSYAKSFDDYRAAPVNPRASQASVSTIVAGEARQYRLHAKRGQAIGRIKVPRLGVNMILVEGTDGATLKKGPGRDRRTYMPGEGQLIYVAGHRTTYLAPFAHIERMRDGDPVTLEVPYGTFVYRVFRSRIVEADNLSVLRSHGREVVELQACHPRFFASQRYIVYARLARVEPRGGDSFQAPAKALAAAPYAASQG
jgi:sortase A